MAVGTMMENLLSCGHTFLEIHYNHHPNSWTVKLVRLKLFIVLFNCFNYLQLTLASGLSVYKPSLYLELSLKVVLLLHTVQVLPNNAKVKLHFVFCSGRTAW